MAVSLTSSNNHDKAMKRKDDCYDDAYRKINGWTFLFTFINCDEILFWNVNE